MKKARNFNEAQKPNLRLGAVIRRFVVPKFYIRSINLCFILFPKTVNKCIVFDGFNRPYVCQTNDIRWDMSFKQICV
jgi:hypothetical protein